MRKEYEEELEELKAKMEKAELFARTLHIFADQILRDKITGEEDWVRFGHSYGKIYLAWGINRGFYRNGGNRTINNYPKEKEYKHHLFNVYINTISLFDAHQEFGLYDYLKGIDIFFSDQLNTTFYIEDEHIHAFLEAINTWYCDAADKLKKHRLQEQEEKLKRQLEETQKQLGTA